jgi:transposase InsO family protein
LKQLEGKPFGKNALLHSDQGFQYTTRSYENQLKELKIQGSHSRRGNCHDNACIESFFSHLKTEKLYLVRPNTIEQAYQAIQEFTTTVVFKKNLAAVMEEFNKPLVIQENFQVLYVVQMM